MKTLPPIHDPSQWPLRLSIAQFAHVWGVSRDTVERRIKAGTCIAPDSDRKFSRESVTWFLSRGISQMDEQREREARRGRRLTAVK